MMKPSDAAAAPATGPLRPHPTNPRYFADGSGRLVYHVVSFADSEKDCRRPLSPFTINGYDRIVCLRSPQG